MTTADVLELVAELVVDDEVDEARAVVSVVWLLPLPLPEPVAVAEAEETTDVVALALLPSDATLVVLETVEEVLAGLEADELGLLIVVETEVEELELELLEELLSLEEEAEELVLSVDSLILNGNEYWKVDVSESMLILMP